MAIDELARTAIKNQRERLAAVVRRVKVLENKAGNLEERVAALEAEPDPPPEPDPVPAPEPTPDPAPDPEPPTEPADPVIEGLKLLRHDDGRLPDARAYWGNVEAAALERHTHFTEGGPNGGPFRRLEIRDGDYFSGERSELGRNEHRYGLATPESFKGTFFIYRPGRYVTRWYVRLPHSFPASVNAWQVVMQMKQTQPSAGGGGTPWLSMEVFDDSWNFMTEGSEFASLMAAGDIGNWVRFETDIVYSIDPDVGHLVWRIDRGDGWQTIYRGHRQTLKAQTSTDSYFAKGEALPAHLRLGTYRNPTITGDTHMDIADTRVYG